MAFLFFHCGNRETGCTDVNAVNFDPEADINEECQYPKLNVSFAHLFDGVAFRPDSVYINDVNDTFRIKEVKFLFSYLHPVRDGIEFEMEDTITIDVGTGGVSDAFLVEDNFGRPELNTFSFDVGTFIENGSFDGIHFILGLSDRVNELVPDSLAEKSHTLARNLENDWVEGEGYNFVYLKLETNLTAEEPLVRELRVFGADEWMKIEMEKSLTFNRGYNINETINVDYDKWFSGMKFVDFPEGLLNTMLKENIPGAFSIK